MTSFQTPEATVRDAFQALATGIGNTFGIDISGSKPMIENDLAEYVCDCSQIIFSDDHGRFFAHGKAVPPEFIAVVKRIAAGVEEDTGLDIEVVQQQQNLLLKIGEATAKEVITEEDYDAIIAEIERANVAAWEKLGSHMGMAAIERDRALRKDAELLRSIVAEHKKLVTSGEITWKEALGEIDKSLTQSLGAARKTGVKGRGPSRRAVRDLLAVLKDADTQNGQANARKVINDLGHAINNSEATGKMAGTAWWGLNLLQIHFAIEKDKAEGEFDTPVPKNTAITALAILITAGLGAAFLPQSLIGALAVGLIYGVLGDAAATSYIRLLEQNLEREE